MDAQQLREARFELEHISGLGATLRRARDRFGDVKRQEPLGRAGAFRHAVADTGDDFHRTLARINRWWPAWDRACDKLLRALFRRRAAGVDS